MNQEYAKTSCSIQSAKKSKDYYSFIISVKAQLPSNAKTLKHDFHLSDNDLKLAFTLTHLTTQEPYVKSFQYKVLNSILYTNKKLFVKLIHHIFVFVYIQICCGKALNNYVLQ